MELNDLEIMARYLNWDCWKCKHFLWFGNKIGSSCKKKMTEPKRLFTCEKFEPLRRTKRLDFYPIWNGI